jgi:hypothetical protein
MMRHLMNSDNLRLSSSQCGAGGNRERNLARAHRPRNGATHGLEERFFGSTQKQEAPMVLVDQRDPAMQSLV